MLSSLPALNLLAYHHHHAASGTWIGHMIVSSLVHGLIYGVIFKAMHHLTLPQAAFLAVVVVGGLYLWNRAREGARW